MGGGAQPNIVMARALPKRYKVTSLPNTYNASPILLNTRGCGKEMFALAQCTSVKDSSSDQR